MPEAQRYYVVRRQGGRVVATSYSSAEAAYKDADALKAKGLHVVMVRANDRRQAATRAGM